MQKPWDEGMKMQNNIPLTMQCLIQNFNGPLSPWWHSMHYHEYIEILYALKGTFLLMINGDIVEMTEGSMYVINSGEPHCTKSAFVV